MNCLKCNALLTDENWYPSHRARNARICKECCRIKSAEQRRQKPERSREYSRKYYRTHPKYNIAWGRQNRIDIRRGMLAAYGGKCMECGIDNPIVLDIDHINHNGGSDRRKGMWGWRLYRWLRKHGYPKDNYQLLCRNCNWIKEIERRRAAAAA